MADSLDQVFVSLKQWILGWPFWPDELKPFLSALMVVAALLLVFATLFAITTVFERKGLARIQNRYGPNRVGIPFTKISLFGFGQPIADGIKALIKEDFVPLAADKVVHFLAPLTMLVPISLTFAVLPVGRNMVATDMDAGLLFFFAVGAGAELAVFMAGWSSRNKYSLFGAMRAIAQMISYEITLGMSLVVVLLIAGNVPLGQVVAFQQQTTWFVLAAGVAYLMFHVGAFAETNRLPFDLPEAEAELVAGYHTEYSSLSFAAFYMSEYIHMTVASALITRALPNLVTLVAWRSCDHPAPVFEGDVLEVELEVTGRHALDAGGLVDLHVRVRAERDGGTPVLEWRPLALMA